jgi:hypothetical protein
MLDRVRPESWRVTEELNVLGRKLLHVADVFEQEDSTAAQNLAGMAWVDWGTTKNNQISNREKTIKENKNNFQGIWADMNTDERIKWLKNWYESLCQKLGMSPTKFRVKDLYDPEGKDAKGVYKKRLFGLLGWVIIVDIDNVKDNNPFEVMNTVAHETRHQYQRYLIKNPEKRPNSISGEQIDEWEENFKNYKKPQDDFEAYRKQPVERDAREAGSEAVDKYFESDEGML